MSILLLSLELVVGGIAFGIAMSLCIGIPYAVMHLIDRLFGETP